MSAAPFDDRDGSIWLDGSLIDYRDAKIHVLSHGLHYASAVFEGERLYNGSIFKSQEHTDRLLKSANVVGYEIPYSVEEIEKAKLQVVEAMDHDLKGQQHKSMPINIDRQTRVNFGGTKKS